MGNRDDGRREFIREMYRVYWSNMGRSMEGIWKVLAPITVAGTIIAGVHGDYLPASFGFAIAGVVIFWALNVTIDLNAWHRRNLFFVSKVEQEVLSGADYGNLLPADYEIPKPTWITFYKIQVITFFVFLGLTVIYAGVWELRDMGFFEGWLMPTAVLFGGLVFTLYNHWCQEKSARRHFEELFGEGEPLGEKRDMRADVDI